MQLEVHGRQVRSVFDLAGTKEPALTGALAFALAHSPRLRDALLDDLGLDGTLQSVTAEARDDGAGRTDIELSGNGVAVVLEAKRGWRVPTADQLSLYCSRGPQLLVVVTDCTDRYAKVLGLPAEVEGIPVVHRSWRHILELVRSAGRDRWAGELLRYLEATVSTLQDVLSNQVFCVSLGRIGGLRDTHGATYLAQDIYFHPHGPRWPSPPTYLGFRWDSHVRTVRHVDAFEVVGDLREAIPREDFTDPDGPGSPHLVYRLGPHIGPAEPLPYGGVNPRSGRHWLFLDLLLTAPTYREAVDKTRQRREAAGLA